MQPQAQPEQPPEKAPNPFLGLLSIFYAPADTFSPSAKRPWLVPLIAAAVLALVMNVMVINVIGMGMIVRNQLESNPRLAEQLGPQAINEAVQRAERGSGQKIFAYTAAMLGVPIIIMITAGVALGGLLISGASTRYSATMGAIAWSTYASLVVHTIGTAVFLAAVNDFHGVDTRNLVMLNASVFLNPETTSKPMRTLVSGIDLIGFWVLYLQTVGLSKLSERVSMKQALTVSVAIYILWLLIRAGFSFFF